MGTSQKNMFLYLCLLLSVNLLQNAAAETKLIDVDEFGEHIIEHNEQMLQDFRLQNSANADKLFKSTNGMSENSKEMNLNKIETTKNNDNRDKDKVVITNKEISKSKKNVENDDDIFGENIEEMKMSNIHPPLKYDGKDDKIFSNMRESAMTVFDEEVLEEELAEASVKPSHTPWTLIGVGVGGGVLVVVLVGVVVAGVMLGRMKKNKKEERVITEADV